MGAAMSTFGRAADRAAEQERRHRRSLAEKRIKLSHALTFVIDTLEDKDIADNEARIVALKVLARLRP